MNAHESSGLVPPRIAWFSPLHRPGEDNSSVAAYCSAQLVPFLQKSFSIDLYTRGFGDYELGPTYQYLSAFERDRRQPYDILFYQVDDSIYTRFLRVHMGQMPGMVWFHDIVFTTFGPEPILNSPWQAAVSGFESKQPQWPERGEEIPQVGPFGFRESAYAAQCLFSNPTGLAEFRRNVKLSLTQQLAPAPACLPMPVDPGLEKTSAAFSGTIAFAGSPRIEQRIHKIFESLRGLKGDYKFVWLLDANESAAAEELLREFEISQVTLLFGRSPKRWAEVAASADIAVHTLFSVYGQPDPYLAQSLVLGLPCIVSRFGATEYLPDALVFKVQAGDTEATEMRHILQALFNARTFDRSERVREFALQRHSRNRIAEELKAYWQYSLSAQRAFRQAWKQYEAKAAKDLLNEARSLIPAFNVDAIQRICAPCIEEFKWEPRE
jgi:glycosyltransferase involved in cell wall biosynthesis